jgi:crotonobetainyl-CoA:carnitine CoA-transferase CaiB-like acyl-CoA transferase
MRRLPDVTIIELARLYPAPFCSITLADLGAEVFRFERSAPSIYAGEPYG